MRFFAYTCAVVLSGVLMIQLASTALADAPVGAFARLPKYGDISVSPDGRFFASKTEMGGKYYLTIQEIIGPKSNMTYVAKTGKLEVRWTEWASPTRVLVSLGFSSRRYGTPTYETRLLAVNYDGSKIKDMVKQRKGEWIVQTQDQVIDFLPNDPNHILMAHNDDDPTRPRVYKTNIFTGKGKVIQNGQRGVRSWGTDNNGNVRIGYGQKDKAWQWVVRNTPEAKWRQLRSYGALSTQNFSIWGFGERPNTLLVSSNHEGSTSGLYEYSLQTNNFTRKIFRHAEVDVEDALRDERTGRLRRVSYTLNGTHYKWLDPVAKSHFKSLEKALPGMGISIVSVSYNDNVWVIHAGSITKPGGYYIYDKRARQIKSFGPNYPELEGVTLSRMIPFNYQARDGLTIPAYLSVPPYITNHEKASNLPLVVMPHGGPTSRDYLSFDPYVQHLTDNGYAVLQMNFRGSEGYGAAFEAAGYREWGGKMQDDVTDGVRNLISRGIADPNRICIVGGSYGGYAALMGAAKTPDLYKCAAGLNGVYDLKDLINADRRYIGGRSGLRTARIGSLSDKAFLKRASPEEQAHKIKIPILLVAADNDRTVRARQSKNMAKALKRAKVDYQFLELENGGHGLVTYESRLSYMRTLEQFLAKHLK